MYDVLIKNGKVVTSEDVLNANVLVKDGKVAAVASWGCLLYTSFAIAKFGVPVVFMKRGTSEIKNRDGGSSRRLRLFYALGEKS